MRIDGVRKAPHVNVEFLAGGVFGSPNLEGPHEHRGIDENRVVSNVLAGTHATAESELEVAHI